MNKKTVYDWKEEWKFEAREYRNPVNMQLEEGIVLTKYKGKETEVVVPEKIGRRAVLAIEWPAFSGNHSITSVVIPESVKVLGGRIFRGCEALEKVDIQGKDVVLCDECFFDCPVLSEVKIDVSTAKFGDHIFQKSFRMLDENGFVVLEDGAEKVLVDVQLPVFSDIVVIPEGITRLLGAALSERRPWEFPEVDRVKTVVLPETVKEIGSRFFSDCVNLERINLPNGVMKIGEEAFHSCRNLREINLPGDTCEIGPWAFSGCKKMPKKIIVEPESIQATERFGRDSNIESYLVFEYRQYSLAEEEWEIPEAIFKMSPQKCADKVLSGKANTLQGLEYNQENNPAILKCICDMLEEESEVDEGKAQYAVRFLERIVWNYNMDEELVKRLFQLIQNSGVQKALEIFEKNKILKKIVKVYRDEIGE